MAALAAGNPVLLVPQGDVAFPAMIASWLKAAGWPAIAVASGPELNWADLPELAAVIVGDAGFAARATKMVAARSGARIPVVEPAGAPWRYPLPDNTSYTLLSSSPISQNGDHANSVVYQVPGGAWVFDAGTIVWGWALSGFRPAYKHAPVDPRIQRTTANILDRFVSG